MRSAPETLEGWYALHDLRKVDWEAWKRLSPGQRDDAVKELVAFFTSCQKVEDSPEGSSAVYSVLGHKGDLLILHFRPTLRDLRDLELAFDKTRLAGVTRQTTSFVSVVELSRHGESARGGEGTPSAEAQAYLQRRLKPRIPDTSHVCFYPMNKKREGEDNWFMLPQERRAELMAAHGATGRKYAGLVTQVITGAMGLDDWEWGVTLFADDPLQFKKLVYEMRFDEVSARYAVFGPFYVGLRLQPEDLPEYLGV